MIISEAITILAIVIFIWMTGWWLFSVYVKDASVVDIAWGPGFVLLGWCLMLVSTEKSTAQQVITVLVTLWGLRLGAHILWRKRGKDEDWRYKAMRKKSGKAFWWRSYFKIFILQGLLMSIVAAPLIVSSIYKETSNEWLIYLGAGVWLVGFIFEALGDCQLSSFLETSKKGQIMDKGVWAYTRHPNYFGEITMWWGIWLIALSLTGGWIAVISPLLITFLLLKVSGITMLEAKYEDNKKYQAYKKRTSALIPLPPRN